MSASALTFLFTAKSSNGKTGPMPVTTTARASCPTTCPFMGNGCYAEHGGLAHLWRALSRAGFGPFKSGVSNLVALAWTQLLLLIAQLPAGTLWRHNQAGDLPHAGGVIDADALAQLTLANRGKRGFTYTHHDMGIAANRDAVRAANEGGFTVNLSGNSLEHVDELLALGIAPVVCVLPSDMGGKRIVKTPAGHDVLPCPATYRDDVTCKSCGLCAVNLLADLSPRKVVGFPAHGSAKAAATRIARG